MLDSQPISIFERQFDPTNELHLLAAANALIPPSPPPTRHLLQYSSPQPGGPVDAWISWEAQCAIAGREDMTTAAIVDRHAADIDAQIALLMARRDPPRNGTWCLDACDIVEVPGDA